MKLLFFIHSLSAGGAERVTATLANHFSSLGCEVVIATLTGVEDDFQIVAEDVRRVSMNLAARSRRPFVGLVSNIRRLRALRAVLERERPQVAVAMMPTANSLLAWAGRKAGVPVIGSERVHPPHVPLGMVWETIRRISYSRLSALVAQTRPSADWLVTHTGITPDRVHVIPNPVVYPLRAAPPRLAPAEWKRRLRCRRMLLSVGRLERQKGFDRLLEAFAELAKSQPEWGLVVLGEGRERRNLESCARELGVAERVGFPGVAGNMGDWFEASDLYALCSRFEGFPNTLLEAMAHGVPSIAVDCETGPREIVRDGVDGVLVDQDDERALASMLSRLMNDESERDRLGDRAREVRERFSVTQIAGQWEAVFRAVGAGDV